MGRFSQFRVVDSDDTDNEEEPKLQLYTQQQLSNKINNTYGHDGGSSNGSAHDGGDGRRILSTQPAEQVNDNTGAGEYKNNYIFPPPQSISEVAASSMHGSPTDGVVAAAPISSPDPRNPARQADKTPSVTSSHRSKQSETPSVAQVPIKAFPHEGVVQQVESAPVSVPVREPPAANRSHGSLHPTSHKSTPSTKHSKANTSTTSSAHSPAEAAAPPPLPAAAPAAATTAAADSELIIQYLPQENSHHSEEETGVAHVASMRESNVVAAPASVAVSSGAPSVAAAFPQHAGALSQVNVEEVDNSPDAPITAAAAATDAPKQKKVSMCCSLFTSSKRKHQKDERGDTTTGACAHGAEEGRASSVAARVPQEKKEKTSGFCGIFSKRKKTDRDADAPVPSVPQQTDQHVDVAVIGQGSVNTANVAGAQGDHSDGELSIPIAGSAVTSGDRHPAFKQQTDAGEEVKSNEDEKKSHQTPATSAGDDEEDLATGEQQQRQRPPSQAEATAHLIPAATSRTASSLLFAVNSVSARECTEVTVEAEGMEKKATGKASVAPASNPVAVAAAEEEDDKPAKEHHTSRVKAVVRRRRQKPERDASVGADGATAAAAGATRANATHKEKNSDSETYGEYGEEDGEATLEKKESNKEETPLRESASAAHLASYKKAEPEGAASAAAAAAATSVHVSTERSRKRGSQRTSADSSPLDSGSYSSYSYSYSYSGSGSYSYSDSYTASSERDASGAAPSKHSVRKWKDKHDKAAIQAPSPAPAKGTAMSSEHPAAKAQPRSSAAAPLSRHTREPEKSRRHSTLDASTRAVSAAEGRFPCWSVRADDLVLREEEPPASMPAYQRRILLDLRARERRDAEEAARDLRELTFRPRIHALPGQEVVRANFIEEERSHSPAGGSVSPSYSPASGCSGLSPRRYIIRQISPHLLEPRKVLQQPALPSFKPEISEFARKEVTHDRGVFQRLYNRSHPPSPTTGPKYSHRPEISDFAKQLYPVPRGGRLPSRHNSNNNGDSAVRHESVFERLYRQRNSPGTSPNVSPSRSAARPPSFHPQITELARRQSEGVPREPVGDRLYRQARSPRPEQHSVYPRHSPNNTHDTAVNSYIDKNTNNNENNIRLLPNGRHHDNSNKGGDTRAVEEVINDQGEYDPQREYATQREYGVDAVVPSSDRASWSSSSLQSSFLIKGPSSVKEEQHRNFSRGEAVVNAV